MYSTKVGHTDINAAELFVPEPYSSSQSSQKFWNSERKLIMYYVHIPLGLLS